MSSKPSVALMVSMLKQIPWLTAASAAGDAERIAECQKHLRELQDLDIGLIGASRVGREVIRMLQSYPRLRIKLHDPHLTRRQAKELGAELVTLEQACRCPVMSIHAPSLPETRQMLATQA